MSRTFLCLLFLVFFALLYPRGVAVVESDSATTDEVKAVQPRGEWFGVVGLPGGGFPGAIGWPSLAKMVESPGEQSQALPEPDIVTFLEKCLNRYDREIKGYTGVLYKHERVRGDLKKPEVVRFEFRESPFSVCMKWDEGAGQALATLYVQGENNNKMLVKPTLLPFSTWQKDPRGPEAMAATRYSMDEFGIKIGTERVVSTWKKKQQEGKLHVAYEGVYYVEKAGNRPCYKIHRSQMKEPEDDGVMDVVLYIDTETWLQVGTTLRNKDRHLIGDYYFRDLRLNPEFPPGHFNQTLLSKK
jgi:hypothetical protein